MTRQDATRWIAGKNVIVDSDFGSKEWEARWLQDRKEECFKEIMMLVSDALLLSAERDMFSINAILTLAIQKLKALGVTCEINGQQRLEYSGGVV